MTTTILTAIALVLVIEGLMPFASPRMWREMMARLANRDDRWIRIMGLLSLIAGALIMFFVHSGVF